MMIFPRMAKIKLYFKTPEINNIQEELLKKLREAPVPISANTTIGIAVGSRGIYKINEMVKAIAMFIREQGASPVIIPAMGSHGGATAKGQKDILAGYGVIEEAIGAPVHATMETVCIGKIKGDIPVYINKLVASLDGVILLNRVKPHTDFHSKYESGLMKQMVIGLGNQRGAENIHSYGLYGLKDLLPEAANLILDKLPILMGIAVLENSRDRIAELHVLPAVDIPLREPELLKRAKELMPYIPFKEIDMLIVEELGKDISGTGMDPNIIGRTFIRYVREEGQLMVRRIVCLDLTPKSHGNGLGVGLADVIPRRLYNKINFDVMYVNVITGTFLERGFIPVVQENDYNAMEVALKCCGRKVTSNNARVVQIRNTLQLDEMFVSIPLLSEIDKNLTWERLSDFDYSFTEDGALRDLLGCR